MASAAERQSAYRERRNAELAQLRADRERAGASFVRGVFSVVQGRAQQRSPDQWLGEDRAARAFVERAAAAPGSTVAAGWTALVQSAFGDFLGSLSPYGAVPHLVSLAQSVEPDTGVLVSFPYRVSGPTGASFTTELGAIPVATSVFALVDVPAAKTLASIIPWSKELSKRSNAEAIFRRLLSEDLAANLDLAILSTAAATASTPAGLLNTGTMVAGFPGGDRFALESDLAAVGSAVSDGGSGNVVYVLPPALLARARVLAPELTAALDLVPSASVPTGRLIAVDARSLIIGIGVPEIMFGDHALLHMSDTALPIMTGGTQADPQRSNWQTATTAVRLLCDVTWAKRRAGATAYSAVSW